MRAARRARWAASVSSDAASRPVVSDSAAGRAAARRASKRPRRWAVAAAERGRVRRGVEAGAGDGRAQRGELGGDARRGRVEDGLRHRREAVDADLEAAAVLAETLKHGRVGALPQRVGSGRLGLDARDLGVDALRRDERVHLDARDVGLGDERSAAGSASGDAQAATDAARASEGEQASGHEAGGGGDTNNAGGPTCRPPAGGRSGGRPPRAARRVRRCSCGP